ncbi:histidine kinase [Prauserella marina]|uniref:Two-component system, LytT family, sensor kinase n=1 Tax=Prauserella marina TaxID=530584 RepID=A0A222VMU2_9PSEU|nr:histidine kinase [Prauserella marina]ASR35041.1 histidine kinase [Prauserella marina]PWV85221.1 two-component system LytT family sensor kinase [Prauserella marina]SDC02047.1 two-component system, LytT family, sensor kinase [Prauserella marina]
MPVPAEPADPGTHRGPAWSRRVRDPATVLEMARHVSDDLADGLAGPRARSAARGIRRLLAADGIGLTDLTGELVTAGALPPDIDTAAMVEEVLHTESRCRRAEVVAVPLVVHDELAGVLVVAGTSRMTALREVANLLVAALERSHLEESAEQAAEAELRALRAEISPHFVYNALTVIASFVRSDPDRSRELMLDFADYIRYSLASHGEYTTVADEFHAIETYLALQRAVLGDRLRVQIRVAPEVLAVAIPFLVLQPIVENAVRHGIERRAEGGTVHVLGEAEGSDCLLSVEDDGVGMAPEKASALLAGEGASTSMGLANVDRRLRNVYGPWFGLVVETAEDEGTRVLVRVPRFQPGVVP